KAVVICINNKSLDKSFCGKEFNEDFLSNLPEDVDPCGENGEFHTFCYDGPIFKYPIRFKKGEQVFKEYKSPSKSQKSSKLGFWFQDLRFI
ncbi:MAG: ATP-binding protein, partial [Brumimicrobium sp.]